ncbi:MAG: RsmD family RNA methyltransferase [Oligoflexales bacterium]|nr:RsmD family RNA methyltransferase [Oligoflexales bacterium]
MKIGLGFLRGMALRTPSGQSTRPTSSRVRESLVHLLGADLEDVTFVDFFAGSGSVGLQMLSSGAQGCLFVETDKQAEKALKENIKNAVLRFKKQDIDPHPIKVISKDITHLQRSEMKSLLPKHSKLMFWADPPYDEGVAIIENLLGVLSFVEEETIFLCELSSKQLQAHEARHGDACFSRGGWECLKRKKYGDTAILIWRKKPNEGQSFES